ncbi:MAG: hypothetical protein WC352_01270 [Candidatus Omnitrophota bacterium]|jgi:tetratricopeptide (TPR) repeat protein
MNHKNVIQILAWVTMISLIGGCQSKAKLAAANASAKLEAARQWTEAGEYYRARSAVGEILRGDPQNTDAQNLMNDILNREVAKEREVFADQPREEMSSSQSADQAAVWLDRAQTLLGLGEYEQALDAAENVFLFDPENTAASRLIDRIRKDASSSDKQGRRVWDDVARSEMDFRVQHYRKSARADAARGQWGAARFAVDKILILIPDDEEALALRREIEQKTSGPKGTT